ncbi:MAG: hypothetical protein H0W68_05565 [Gemmatimonadaceae bacterium]|nr:hypothetical protein [Gemmatimonadaceae bacterium]
MWADTLFAAERAHLVRLLVWGAASVLAGTGLLAWLRWRRHLSPLLEQFAALTAGWGATDVVIGLLAFRALSPRDLAGATRLDRLLWLYTGLDAGYVLVGLTLVVVGWRIGRRPRMLGTGTAVVVQGGALLLMHLLLAAHISR